jgi:DNA polymerase-4
VTCSIGLSTSKTVSKIASERNKPNGTTVVWPGTEGAFLAPLPVRAMSGVGPRTAEALERAGVRTLGELAQADPQVLAGLLGVAGPRLVERARGLDRSPVAPCDAPDDVKSVSSERTFAHDLSTREELVSALGYIAATTARRLRGKGLAGRTVTVKVTYRYGESRSARASLARPSCDERDLLQAALGVLDQLWSEGVGVRLLGVGVSNWDAGGVQPTLFDDLEADEAEQESRRRLAEATDRLRERFGDTAVMYGSELRFRDAVSNTASAHRKDG